MKIATAILLWLSFCFRILSVDLRFVLVFLLELAFHLQPIVQVATVNSAALNVNLKRSPTDFRWRWSVLPSFFRELCWNDAFARVSGIGDQILRFHGFSSRSRAFRLKVVFCLSDHLG